MKNISWKQSIACFLSAQSISLFGSSLVQYAIVWHITLTTSSGKMLTLSTLCGFLPQLLISLFGGVWIDRYNRKTIIMLADGIIAISTLILAIAFLAGYGNVWLLFLVLIIRSAGAGIQTPAVSAIIPQIVPKEALMRVSGINSTLSSIMMFLSPVVSGAILSLSSLETTLFVDVVTAILGIGITAFVPVKPMEQKKEVGYSHLAELKDGFSYVLTHKFVKRLLMFQVVILFLISPTAFLTPLMVSRSFGNEVWRLTASEMTYSLGMVLGGIFLSWKGRNFRGMNITLMAGGLYGLFMIGLGSSPIFALYLLCNTLIGVTAPCYNAPITVTLQQEVPPEFQGRIFSFMQITTSSILPLGMTLFGPMADWISPRNLFICAGGLVCLACIVAWKSSYFETVSTQK